MFYYAYWFIFSQIVMEVSVYLNLEAKRSDKPVVKRMVVSPDVFDFSAFIKSIKSVFGNSCVIEIMIVSL